MKRFYSSSAEPIHINALIEKKRPMYSSRSEQILNNAMLEIKRRKLASKENVDNKDTPVENIQNSTTTKKRLIFDQVTQYFCVHAHCCRLMHGHFFCHLLSYVQSKNAMYPVRNN